MIAASSLPVIVAIILIVIVAVRIEVIAKAVMQ